MAASSGSKAFFTNVDTGSVFFVQFNPKEFKLDEKADWKASDEHENDVPLLTYEKGEPTVVTMDLVFDSTDDGSDVYKKYVEPLRDFLTADVSVTDGEGDKMKRPPYCKFTWASFVFDCVVEKISATCLMFKADGTALRAKVQVGLKERVRNVNGGGSDSVTLSALGSMFSGAAGSATTYTTQNGDTLSAIAAKTKAKLSDIAIANNVSDPMNIPPGQQFVIPADSKLAAILAAQNRKNQSGNWQTSTGGQGPRARGGYTGGAPSAFDDPPVQLDYDVDPGGIALQYASFNTMDYDVRGDSQGAGGSAGQGIAQAIDAHSHGALDFRDDATPDHEGAHHAALDYGVRGDSQGAGGTAGAGSGGYDVRGDSEGTLGDAGKNVGSGDFGDSEVAQHFRNNASPDEQGAGHQAQTYDARSDSDGTFGDAGKNAGSGDFGDSEIAQHFRNDASPDEQGAGPQAQGYDTRGDSDGTFGDAGKNAGSGQFGDSELAQHFRDNATPDGQGSGPTAQHYGGYGASDGALGTSGQGAGSGGGAGHHSDGTFGSSGQGGGGGGGFGLSDKTFGSSGQGGGSGSGAHHLSDVAGASSGGTGSAVGGAGGGAGGGGHAHAVAQAFGLAGADGTSGGAAQGYGGGGLSDQAGGSSGQGTSGSGVHHLSDHAAGAGGASGDGSSNESFKDLLAAHGRVGDGTPSGDGGNGHPQVADAVQGSGTHASSDGDGKHGVDFRKAFEAAKTKAEKTKKGE